MSGGTHLRLEERERLAALKGEGLSLRAMARQLGRAASTISRAGPTHEIRAINA
jgi:IS30 family transposase